MLDLTQDQLNDLRRILDRRLPKREVRAFGSRVTGDAKPHSDLDLVVMDETPIADLAWAQLRLDLEESDLPFKVDVLHWPQAPESLRAAIARQSETITH